MTPERLHKLFDAYVDQTLTPSDRIELEQALVSSKSACKEFWQHVELHAQIRELMLQAEGEQKLPTIHKVPSGQSIFRTSWIPALAAAAVVMVAVGWWWLSGSKSGETVAKVVGVHGPVVTKNLKDNKSRNIQTGEEIATGEIVETGKDGEVKLAYGNGVAYLVLGEKSKLLTAKSKSEKTLRLEIGQLTATVTKQPKDKPFIVTTPHAKTTVIGTSFTLKTDIKKTRLEVADGIVRTTRLSDERAVDVSAGNRVVVAEGIPMDLTAMDVSQNSKLPENVVFFRDFEALPPGEHSPNELVILEESEREITALVSLPAESQTATFRPDVRLKLERPFSKNVKEAPLYIIPADVEIRIRIRSEYPGKIDFVQKPTHVLFKMEHFDADGLYVDSEWRDVVVRSGDVQPYMKEGASRDFTPGVEIGSFSIYGFGTGQLFLDSFAVVSTTNGLVSDVQSRLRVND
jgi:ferric-dicitrate binding protein FerR (iron transport regulator)